MNLDKTACRAIFWKYSTLWHINFLNIYIIMTILHSQYFGTLFEHLILNNIKKD